MRENKDTHGFSMQLILLPAHQALVQRYISKPGSRIVYGIYTKAYSGVVAIATPTGT